MPSTPAPHEAPPPPRPAADLARTLSIADIDAQFRAATAAAESVAAGLDVAAGRARPADGGWSVADCLAHLTATTRVYLPVFTAAIARAGDAGRGHAGEPFRLGIVGRWMVGSMEPPVRRRMRAPRVIAPAGGVALAEAVTDFVDSQRELRRCVGSAAGLDLGGVRIRSPLAPILRMRLGTAFALVAAHQRRHLWQARRVRDAVTARAG